MEKIDYDSYILKTIDSMNFKFSVRELIAVFKNDFDPR